MKICDQCQAENSNDLLFCQNCFAELPAPTNAAEIQVREQQSVETSSVAVEETTIDMVPQDMPLPPARPEKRQKAQGQLGSGKRSAAGIWGPFAGYGTRGRHHSWMLDEQGEHVDQLRDVVTQRFDRRRIPNAKIHRRTLSAKGIIVENRPYYLIQRGITTMGLHLARFGEDLYISQVTYSLGPINPLRVLLLLLMMFFQLFMIVGYGSMIQNSIGTIDILSGYSGDPSRLGLLLCCIGPLGAVNTVLLILVGLYAMYKFLTEKDPLALLRRPPNEFEIDDIVALEKSVEETVRQSLDAIDLDATKMSPALQYGPRQGRLF